ncbi:hypothetical protein L6452_09897 [Arctium lappa]|uniref:Uncharacterized protein n=1 Tax=Arctium lappa TaxID=4217 RepID=A0ACB9DLR5_ARCLA|nr:hypothetical protein L6452_09897 [Arctium lappa]
MNIRSGRLIELSPSPGLRARVATILPWMSEIFLLLSHQFSSKLFRLFLIFSIGDRLPLLQIFDCFRDGMMSPDIRSTLFTLDIRSGRLRAFAFARLES